MVGRASRTFPVRLLGIERWWMLDFPEVGEWRGHTSTLVTLLLGQMLWAVGFAVLRQWPSSGLHYQGCKGMTIVDLFFDISCFGHWPTKMFKDKVLVHFNRHKFSLWPVYIRQAFGSCHWICKRLCSTGWCLQHIQGISGYTSQVAVALANMFTDLEHQVFNDAIDKFWNSYTALPELNVYGELISLDH